MSEFEPIIFKFVISMLVSFFLLGLILKDFMNYFLFFRLFKHMSFRTSVLFMTVIHIVVIYISTKNLDLAFCMDSGGLGSGGGGEVNPRGDEAGASNPLPAHEPPKTQVMGKEEDLAKAAKKGLAEGMGRAIGNSAVLAAKKLSL
jgi:hypothetical protein